MAKLYATIQLQGVGWEDDPLWPKYPPGEEAYKELCKVIARAVASDGRFVSGLKTVSIEIRGYDPVVKSLLIDCRTDPNNLSEITIE